MELPALLSAPLFYFGTFYLINPVTQQLLHVWNKTTPQATAKGSEMDPWIKCTKSKFFPRVLETKLGRISPSGCNIRYGIWRVDGSWTRLGQRRKNCFPKRRRTKSRLGRVLLCFRLCFPLTLEPRPIPIPTLGTTPASSQQLFLLPKLVPTGFLLLILQLIIINRICFTFSTRKKKILKIRVGIISISVHSHVASNFQSILLQLWQTHQTSEGFPSKWKREDQCFWGC